MTGRDAAILIMLMTLAVWPVSFALAQTAPRLPLDSPQTVNGVDVACTGVGSDARADPRWNAYPLRAVLAGAAGQFLGAADIAVADAAGNEVLRVHCGGPWVLLGLPPGRYRITAQLDSGETAATDAFVREGEQGRVILRFPETGGAVSSQHVPAMD